MRMDVSWLHRHPGLDPGQDDEFEEGIDSYPTVILGMIQGRMTETQDDPVQSLYKLILCF